MNNPFNEQSIQIYIGEKRSCKTLAMTGDTYELIKGRTDIIVYANYHLNKKYFPTFQFITRDDLAQFYKNKDGFKKCIFLIDEMHIFLDARKFMDKGNQAIQYFIGQMGKRGNILKGNTHFPRLLDFRTRAYCEKWIYIKKCFLDDGNINFIKNYNKEMTSEENKILYAYCEPIIRKLVDFDFQYTKEDIYLIKADKYFNMYDTEELIFLEDKENNIDT